MSIIKPIREPCIISIRIEIVDEYGCNLRAQGPFFEWWTVFQRALDRACKEYQSQKPIGEARINFMVDLDIDPMDDEGPILEITLHGERHETEEEVEARWKRSEEYKQEWVRREEERKEREERAELARLQQKYGVQK